MDRLVGLMLSAILFMSTVDKSVGIYKLHTGTAKNYNLLPYDISDRTSIVFEVKACHDIHVLLVTDPSDTTTSVYEIAIGGWNNRKSVIRKRIFGTNLVENHSSKANCNAFKSFWIDWTSGTITVGEGFTVGTGEFLNYADPNSTPVNRFMISTGYGASGIWHLGSSCSLIGDPHQTTLDGIHFTYSGICLYDILYIDNDFFIRGHYEKCWNIRSCVDEVYIHYKSHLISLLKNNIVKDGSTTVTSFPHTTSDGLIKIYKTSDQNKKYKVVLPNAVNVNWNGNIKIWIDVAMSFYGVTKGLCGLYNQNNADDLTLRNGTAVGIGDKDTFGNNWAVASGSTTNLALNKNVTQSSYWPDPGATDNGAHKAIDGCNSTSWSDGCCTHTHKNLNAWWNIDLEEKHAIFRIVISLRTDCCNDRMRGFQVFVSESELTDTTNAVPVYTSPSDVDPGPSVEIKPMVPGRYVKIVIPGREEYLTICEVEIYGDEGCVFV